MDSGADQESFAEKKWCYLEWNTKCKYVQCAGRGPGLRGQWGKGKVHTHTTLLEIPLYPFRRQSCYHTLRHPTLTGLSGLQGQFQGRSIRKIVFQILLSRTPVNLEENKMPKLSPIPRFYDWIYISLATVDVRKPDRDCWEGKDKTFQSRLDFTLDRQIKHAVVLLHNLRECLAQTK